MTDSIGATHCANSIDGAPEGNSMPEETLRADDEAVQADLLGSAAQVNREFDRR
ncbi:hypothetical protein [Nocardia ninae]|uniref:hypothetical protein n=1 Tax=Nocardia ninae TaxID=356145 RepID=UPI001649D5B5|nr:hypothetical protein [Nocardia ninae]